MTAESGGLPLFRLLVISGAVFAAVSSEFLPTAILPQIAAELRVSEAQVGLLVTLFAFTVAITTVPLAALARRLSRKWLMVALLVGFAATNVVCAITPNYGVLAGARVLGGLCHGLFWSVTGPYAAHLVRPTQLARALTVTNAGGTLAFVLGVPFGAAIGLSLGWRAAFAVMAGIVLVFAALVALFLPPVDHRVPLATGEIPLPVRRDPSLGPVLVVGGVVLLVALGQNVNYTYIAPWLIGPGQVPEHLVSVMLLVYGAAGALGLAVVGVAGDRWPLGTLVTIIVGLGVSVLLLALFARGPALAGGMLALWSLAFAGFPSLIQARALRTASRRLRDLSSAIVTVSFNASIGGGALIGAGLLGAVGLAVLPWAQLAFTVAALAFVLVALVWWPRRAGVRPR